MLTSEIGHLGQHVCNALLVETAPYRDPAAKPVENPVATDAEPERLGNWAFVASSQNDHSHGILRGSNTGHER